MGSEYLEGDRLRRDERLAAEFLSRAAERDHAGGLYLLGRCHAEGRGVARDLRRAEELYCRSAELGDRDAAQALKELRAATARKPQEPPQKGGFLGLLKKFKGK